MIRPLDHSFRREALPRKKRNGTRKGSKVLGKYLDRPGKSVNSKLGTIYTTLHGSSVIKYLSNKKCGIMEYE